MSIEEFNKKLTESNAKVRLSYDVNAYNVKPAKKTGKPNLDLPSIYSIFDNF